MKKTRIIPLFIILFACLNNVLGQQEYGDFNKYSSYELDKLNTGDFQDVRLRKQGDRAFQIYAFVPIEIKTEGTGLDTTFSDIDIKHRLSEKILPNFKYYLTDKSDINFCVFYRGQMQTYKGIIDTALSPSIVSSEFEKKTSRGVFLRTAYNRHLALQRFKKFDLDVYSGAALSLGFMPGKSISNTEFTNSDHSYSTTKSKNFGLGADIYGGVNLQFERFSFGLEILALGFDYNRGFGKSKFINETSIGGLVTTTEGFILDGSANVYSKLKLSNEQTTMYRGLRFSACYYF